MGRLRDWFRRTLDSSGKPTPLQEGEGVWLVLGGGGLKGLAHVGAWKALQEADVQVEGIVGTSIGALVGAAIAGGAPPAELEERARSVRPRDIARLRRRAVWVNGLRSSSVLRASPLQEYILASLPVHTWDELRLPLQVNAVELGSGETTWFGVSARADVSLPEAIYASTALPVLYPPARIGDGLFVDGGTGDALGLARARDLDAPRILAIDVGSGGTYDAAKIVERGMVAIHQRVFSIQSGAARRVMVEGWTGPPLALIRPQLDGYGSFDFQHVDYFVDEGYRATREKLMELSPESEPSHGDETELDRREARSRS